jgi:hypothetical protein
MTGRVGGQVLDLRGAVAVVVMHALRLLSYVRRG